MGTKLLIVAWRRPVEPAVLREQSVTSNHAQLETNNIAEPTLF